MFTNSSHFILHRFFLFSLLYYFFYFTVFFSATPALFVCNFLCANGLWWPRIRNTAMRKGIRCIRNEKQNYMSTMEMKNIPMAHTNTTEKRTSSITLPQSIFIKVVLAWFSRSQFTQSIQSGLERRKKRPNTISGINACCYQTLFKLYFPKNLWNSRYSTYISWLFKMWWCFGNFRQMKSKIIFWHRL